MTDLREGKLLARAQVGDLDAFREIVESHHRQISFLAREMTGNADDAEDGVQEVFIKAYRSLSRFRGESKLSSWLYRIAIRTCLDHSRHQKRQRWASFIPLHQAFGLSTTRVDANPAQMQEAGRIRDDIERAVDKLTPLERSIFVLRHHRELKIREIAEVLERSEGTVKNILFRAVRKLRTQLAAHRPHLSQEEFS